MLPSYKVEFYKMRLTKLKSDAVHFLNYGHRNMGILYKGNVESHITEMLLLCDYLEAVGSPPILINIKMIEGLEVEMLKG